MRAGLTGVDRPVGHGRTAEQHNSQAAAVPAAPSHAWLLILRKPAYVITCGLEKNMNMVVTPLWPELTHDIMTWPAIGD